MVGFWRGEDPVGHWPVPGRAFAIGGVTIEPEANATFSECGGVLLYETEYS